MPISLQRLHLVTLHDSPVQILELLNVVSSRLHKCGIKISNFLWKLIKKYKVIIVGMSIE